MDRTKLPLLKQSDCGDSCGPSFQDVLCVLQSYPANRKHGDTHGLRDLSQGIKSDRRFSGGFEDWAKDNEVRAIAFCLHRFVECVGRTSQQSDKRTNSSLPAIHFRANELRRCSQPARYPACR